MIAPSAPVLTEKTDPSPGVEVYFASLDGDGETITVWRIADGVREEVRGAKRAPVSGDFVVTDWEVPFGVVSTYVADLFDSGGASVSSGQAAITVVSDDVWFSNPIDPTTGFIVNLEASAFSTISTPRRTEQVFVAGVRLPFEQNWGAGGIQGLPFKIWTDTDDGALALQSLLLSSPLVVRTPPRFVTLPRVLSASIKQPIHDPFDWRYQGHTIVWTLTVDEVQPVSKAVLRPLVTWDDWQAAYPAVSATWADVIADYGTGTWTDAQRTPPVA